MILFYEVVQIYWQKDKKNLSKQNNFKQNKKYELKVCQEGYWNALTLYKRVHTKNLKENKTKKKIRKLEKS